MRRPAASLGLCSLLLVATPGMAFAGCGESIALLAKQVGLIGAAGPLAADLNAPLGPGDTLLTLENPDLKSRTGRAFNVFEAPQQVERKKAGEGFSASLARAREALGNARTALDRGDSPVCEEAITVGLAAAQQARIWLSRGTGPS